MPQQPPPQHPLIRRVCECECVPRAPDEEAERVQKIHDAVNRHLAGLQKAVREALELVEECGRDRAA